MARTKNRALAEESMPAHRALIFGTVTGIAGSLLLGFFTNILTLALAVLGFFFYVVVYGFYKRRSVHGTLVGSLSGAVPPVIGYSAVSNELDGAALILFLILIFWQMPHFYAIAMYRSGDYAAASIPVLPLIKNATATKVQIALYIIAFTGAALALTIFGYTGPAYAVTAAILGASWLFFAAKGLKTSGDNLWARQMFLFSLVVITVLSITISVDSVLL